MAVQTVELDVQPLHRSFQMARRRLWWQRGIQTVARSICVALGTALLASLLAGWQAPEGLRGGLWTAAALAPLAGLLAALLTRPSFSEAARIVDLRLDLQQQLGTAEELLSRGVRGELASLQVAKASDLARELSTARAFPLVPKREASLALLLAVLTTCLLVALSMGYTLPNPLSAIRLPSFSREETSPAEQDLFGSLRERDAAQRRSPAMEPFRQMLDELQRQSQRGSISASAATAALAQANAELNRVAADSRIRQEALEKLANELRGTSAGREAAESLRQGDYDRAAEQLRELGRQSDRLSPTAKQELSEALNRAAARSQSAQQLSRSESAAAEALREGDYSSVVESMDRLARSVEETADQMVSQSELAEAWQRMEEMGKQFGRSPSQGANARPPLSPPVAQAPQGAAERRGNLQQGSGPGQAQAQAGMEGSQASKGPGQPGNMRGGPPLGEEKERLGPDGTPLEVEGRVGDRFPGEPGSDSQNPSVLREGKANSLSSPGAQGAEGPISVPDERVIVPGDRRPIVRDYFTRGSRGQ